MERSITETEVETTNAEISYSSSNSLVVITSKEELLAKKQEEYQAMEEELNNLHNQYNTLNEEKDEEIKKKELYLVQEETAEKQISLLKNRMQEIVQKKNNAMSLLEEKKRDIGAISSIPAGAENYRNHSQSQLKNLLSKANKHLLKFDKVNRKAMSQYLLFSERKNEFIKRHKELEEGLESIHTLITVRNEL